MNQDSRLKILQVDDCDTSFIEVALGNRFELVLAHSLQEAEEVMRSSLIFLIICDDLLANGSEGIDFLPYIDNNFSDVPFIYFHDDPFPKRSSRKSGALIYIRKSDLSLLKKTVDSLSIINASKTCL